MYAVNRTCEHSGKRHAFDSNVVQKEFASNAFRSRAIKDLVPLASHVAWQPSHDSQLFMISLQAYCQEE